MCFCLGDENLYLEQVLVEQEGVPIFFLCKSREQHYLALFVETAGMLSRRCQIQTFRNFCMEKFQ